ncbi:MAG: protein-L-isoaspartate O-methyltransferase [Magnetovibrio sp.]|nr:protein-L-isoaspartate O-methyltransferase [Magnetovibrio sp.]
MLSHPITNTIETIFGIKFMDYVAARQNMVDCQVLPNRVTNLKVVEGMLSLPREKFVPLELMDVAYLDGSLPLGSGRYLMKPMIMARLLDTIEPDNQEVAMVVGCASGYLTALLASMVSSVVAVEVDKTFNLRVGETFKELGIDNVLLVKGSLNGGFNKQSPYDVIVFDGAVAVIPDSIIEQLADGGRLIAIVIGEDGVGRVTLVTRHGEVISSRNIFEASAQLLPGFEHKVSFSF